MKKEIYILMGIVILAILGFAVYYFMKPKTPVIPMTTAVPPLATTKPAPTQDNVWADIGSGLGGLVSGLNS